MQHAGTPASQRSAMLHLGVHAFTPGFDADDSHRTVIEEGIKQPHGIGAAADGGNQCIRQAAFLLQHLSARFFADNSLEISYHRGIGVGTCHRANAVEGIFHIGHPVAQRVIHRVFQCAATGGDWHHFCAQKLHAKHIWRLALNVMRTHIDHTFQTKFGTNRSGGHPMLTRTGFGDNPAFSHATGQDNLAQDIINFMRTGVVELISFQIDLRTTQMLGQTLRIV